MLPAQNVATYFFVVYLIPKLDFKMASVAIGVIPTFDPEQIEEWIELLEAWLNSNNITEDDRKRSVLFTSLGNMGYHTLRALLQPHKPADKTYKQCVDLLKSHYAPKPSESVLRYRFYTRSQKPNETMPQFIAGLRQLGENCNFAELNNMLRDRLVVGCREAAIQRKLLGEPSLTFEKALNIATAMEMASKDVEKIKAISQPESQSTSSQVNKMQPPRRQKQKYANKSPSVSHSKRKHEESAKAASQSPAQQKRWRCGTV